MVIYNLYRSVTREIDYEIITILGNIARDVFKLESN